MTAAGAAAWRSVRRWLRLGPTRAELAEEVQLWKTRCGSADAGQRVAHVRAKAAEKDLRAAGARIEALVRLLDDRLDEPRREDGCSKVRFHRRPEADDWAAAIGDVSGEGAEAFNSYRCKVCPRSPVTMQRYWHAGHRFGSQAAKAAREERRAAETSRAHQNGRMIVQRVDPVVLDRLRQIRRESRER